MARMHSVSEEALPDTDGVDRVPPKPKPNGLAVDAVQEVHGAYVAATYAWKIGRYAILALFGLAFWAERDGWFTPIARQPAIERVETALRSAEVKLKDHDEILRRLDGYAFDMNKSLARIEGVLTAQKESAAVKASAPAAPASAPTSPVAAPAPRRRASPKALPFRLF